MPHTEVTCPAGTIIGVQDAGVRRFHSVPCSRMAAPFDDPLPAEQGLLVDATAARPGTPSISITAPQGATTLSDLPVVVWIHGGRFETGDHTDTLSNPDVFAHAGVIHVRVGYRLKFPGLMPFHTDAPGHYRAVADCQHALAWIQRNIEAFGGDPTNVTIAGQSAGAAIVLWLMRRDHYRGEFRRALAMSPAFPRRDFTARKWAARGALGTPLTRQALNELAARKPQAIDRGYRRFRTHYLTDVALGPYPLDATEHAEVPLVITATDNEFYRTGAPYDRAGIGPLVTRLVGPQMGLDTDAAADYIAHAKRTSPGHVTGRFMSDALCRRWVDHVAENTPGPVWLAEYAHATHSQDLHPLFSGALTDWLLGFVRDGEVGWPPYSPDRCAARTTLDGQRELIHDPLGYLRGAFRQPE